MRNGLGIGAGNNRDLVLVKETVAVAGALRFDNNKLYLAVDDCTTDEGHWVSFTKDDA